MSSVPGLSPLAPPPELPELPEGVDPTPRWPAWYAPAGLLAAFGGVVLVGTVLAAAAAIAGVDLEDSTTLTIVGTAVQDAILVGIVIFFAARIVHPRLWHFGLRRTRFWPAVGWSLLGMVGYWTFTAVYLGLVDTDAEQTTLDDLGAEDTTLAFVAVGILVIVMAPIAEELFFRAFFFRALRSRFSLVPAAAIDGLVFGLVHAFTGLEAVPILAALGFAFCLVYERTRSLYPLIALHAMNNTAAYLIGTERDQGFAIALGGAMVAACLLLPLALRTRAPVPA